METAERQGLNCSGDSELREEKRCRSPEEVRSSDSPSMIKDGSRPTSPEVKMTIDAAGQLTVFYAGSLRVYDGIPPDKVSEIMGIAAAAAAANSLKKMEKGTASQVLTRCPSLLSSSAAVASPQPQHLPHKLQAELPYTRRHSLQRFFEKRRARLVSKNPYSTTQTADDTNSRMDEDSSPGVGMSIMHKGEFQTNQAIEHD